MPDLPTAPDAPGRGVEDVFRRYAAPVHNYLRAAGASDSEDLLSDVFVDVMRGLDRFRGDEDALRRWVFTIAHHRLVDEHRRRARRPATPAHAQRHMRSAPPDEPLDPALVVALDSADARPTRGRRLALRRRPLLETVAAMTNRAEVRSSRSNTERCATSPTPSPAEVVTAA